MSKRQDVLTALEHRQPQRLPCDFGGTAITGLHVSCVQGLRQHFGLENRPVKVHEPYQMLGVIDEDLAQAMDVSVVGIPSRKTIFGFVNEGWKTWRAPWGQEVLVARDFNTTRDADGNIFVYPEGDTSAPASGHMPGDGYFFDAIIRQDPIDEDHLDPQDNLEEFGLLGEADLRHLADESRKARATGRAVIAGLPGAALGDIALVPATFFKHPRGIRDISEWYISTSSRQDYVHAIFQKQTQIAIENFQRVRQAAGDNIDVVVLCATDFGTQHSQFCSKDTFRSLYLPYYQKMTGWLHANTPWKIFKHSCGAVAPLLPSFIDAGFDVLNPVQCSAVGMDAETLKRAYGNRFTFWGGGVDTQHVLPFGTPEEVRKQVLERCKIFAKGGGFVFNTIHNIQARTPIPNIVAMLDALKEFNG